MREGCQVLLVSLPNKEKRLKVFLYLRLNLKLLLLTLKVDSHPSLISNVTGNWIFFIATKNVVSYVLYLNKPICQDPEKM